MTRTITTEPASIDPSESVAVTTKKQTRKAWKLKDGGRDGMTSIGRLVHFLTEDGATMLFAFLGCDNNAESVSGDKRDTVAGKAKEYFDSVGASKRTKAQILDRMNKLLLTQYSEAYRMWKQSGEGATEENPPFEVALNKVCAHFHLLRSVMGSRRTDPALPMETGVPGSKPFSWKKPEEINSEDENSEQHVDLLTDEDSANSPSPSSKATKLKVPKASGKRKRALKFEEDFPLETKELDVSGFVEVQREAAAKKMRFAEYMGRYQNAITRINTFKLSKEEGETMLDNLNLEYNFY
ncbi:uncharacterized protein EV154DRAFT_578326 [Mucor mucedo]|uniref:uncharacterized protein n=1 Tax=Mucor mucedo TaxID=29922 RepID=UPI0022200F34|nr:uncharacterized protein EV154DRAFT_578326 [Mucor mucedo]KAI7874429.1 hypothetical protein EV154DRAFT_578326 [Mucor mucedo]